MKVVEMKVVAEVIAVRADDGDDRQPASEAIEVTPRCAQGGHALLDAPATGPAPHCLAHREVARQLAHPLNGVHLTTPVTGRWLTFARAPSFRGRRRVAPDRHGTLCQLGSCRRNCSTFRRRAPSHPDRFKKEERTGKRDALLLL